MENRKRRSWNEDSIGRVFGIMYEVLYSMALYHEIRPWERDNKAFDPELREILADDLKQCNTYDCDQLVQGNWH